MLDFRVNSRPAFSVVVYDNETFYKGTKSLYRDGRLVKLDIPGTRICIWCAIR